MEENSGYFSLNGLSGFFIAVVLLLAIVGALGYTAVVVQKGEATNYYTIDGSQANMIDSSNSRHYKTK